MKIAWLLIVVHYGSVDDRIMWTETQYLHTKQQCELFARLDIVELRAAGVKVEHIMTECLQVMPVEASK